MSDMVEVVIDSVRVSLMSPQRVWSYARRKWNASGIWVGPYEAEHITVALQEVELSRPMTHDLFKKCVQSVKAEIPAQSKLSL